MSAELEPRVLEGRVFTDGVAQETVREGGITRVRLTCMPGHPASAHGGTIRFPEPVKVGAGETIVVEVEGLPGSGRPSSMSAHMRNPATFTSAHVATTGAPSPAPEESFKAIS